jgi:hypothetical protein
MKLGSVCFSKDEGVEYGHKKELGLLFQVLFLAKIL